MRKFTKKQEEQGADIDLTPMLDVVFIMLIFFIVTTSFVKEKGLEVARPSSAPPPPTLKKAGPIVVKIDGSSNIRLKGRLLEPKAVQANLEREKAEKPDSPLIIAAHPDAETDSLVNVLNAAKAVNIGSVSVATTTQQ